MAKRLRGLGVNVLESYRPVSQVHWDAVVLADGAVLPSAVTVWTAGFAVPDLATRSGLRTDAMGRLLTDETLTSIDDERIVAAGDAAAPSGQPLRMSCQAALPLGAQAANTVLSRIAGTPRRGSTRRSSVSASAWAARRPPSSSLAHGRQPGELAIGGRTAASIKEAICKGTVWAIRREAAKPGSYFWLKGGKRQRRSWPLSGRSQSDEFIAGRW